MWIVVYKMEVKAMDAKQVLVTYHGCTFCFETCKLFECFKCVVVMIIFTCIANECAYLKF